MSRYRFTVPPTAEQGSYSGNCSASYMETHRKDALRDYNSARAHDGLPPIARMPRGTRYQRIDKDGQALVSFREMERAGILRAD